ncbi:hypothetical protein SAMN05444724_2262 [Salinivibrio sp. ES.052]|nr:hypothetical protein SAMN05444724_2262 [Salinivibrio sp. ES.052]
MRAGSLVGYYVGNIVSKKRVGCGDLDDICGIYVNKSDLIH